MDFLPNMQSQTSKTSSSCLTSSPWKNQVRFSAPASLVRRLCHIDDLNLIIAAFNSIDSCDLKSGEWICIVGCGGLGQYAVQYAKAMGFKVIGM
jgi:hypothetical protein